MHEVDPDEARRHMRKKPEQLIVIQIEWCRGKGLSTVSLRSRTRAAREWRNACWT